MPKTKRNEAHWDVKTAWKEAKAEFRRMTPKEKTQTFVDAGILTSKGKVAKPYAVVFARRATSSTKS